MTMTEPVRSALQPASGKPPIEANVGAGFWRKGPADTLPPPDMVGPYMRNRPVPIEAVEGRKAWIIGSGIAGLAAR
jgi:oleate hydratase